MSMMDDSCILLASKSSWLDGMKMYTVYLPSKLLEKCASIEVAIPFGAHSLKHIEQRDGAPTSSASVMVATNN